MFEKMKATLGGVTEGASALAAAGGAKAREAVDEITQGFAELNRLGLKVDEMEVQVGLIPTLLLTLSRPEDVEDAKLTELLSRAEDKKYWKSLLTAILAAERLSDQIQPSGQRLIAYRFELSVPPKISLVFVPKAGLPSGEVAGSGTVALIPETDPLTSDE